MFKSNRDYKLYIEDIAKECKNIKKFIQNIAYNEFTENLEKVYAVAKAFENIGEAVKYNVPRKSNHLIKYFYSKRYNNKGIKRT